MTTDTYRLITDVRQKSMNKDKIKKQQQKVLALIYDIKSCVVKSEPVPNSHLKRSSRSQ